jgi:hypothetical protein
MRQRQYADARPDRRVAAAPADRDEPDDTTARPRGRADARPSAHERGSQAQPRMVWQTGPAPARIDSATAYAPIERAPANGRGLY